MSADVSCVASKDWRRNSPGRVVNGIDELVQLVTFAVAQGTRLLVPPRVVNVQARHGVKCLSLFLPAVSSAVPQLHDFNACSR